MAAPPVDPVYRQAVEAAIKASIRGGGSVLEQVSRIPAVIEFAAQGAIESESFAVGAPVAVELTEASAGLADLVTLPFLAAAISVLIVARRIHDIERDLLGRIPWVGGKLAFLADISFPFIDQVEGWIVDRLVETVSTLGNGISALVWWGLAGHGGGIPNPTTALIDSRLDPIRSQLDSVAAEVHYLANEISPVPLGSPLTAPLSGGPSAALTARLNEIEARNTRQGEQISQLNQRMAQMESTMRIVSSELEHVRVTLYGARASTVGVQDLVHQIQKLQTTLEVTQGDIESELQTHTDQLTHLAPLLGLLYLGERGLQNLRTLEDNMCQCPKLPRVPAMLPDALSLELAITHGI